jgi:hypothetical protein
VNRFRLIFLAAREPRLSRSLAEEAIGFEIDEMDAASTGTDTRALLLISADAPPNATEVEASLKTVWPDATVLTLEAAT